MALEGRVRKVEKASSVGKGNQISKAVHSQSHSESMKAQLPLKRYSGP